MKRRTFLLSALFAAPAIRAWSQTGAVSAPLPDTRISALLARQVDVARVSPGFVAGVRDARGRRLVPYGRSAPAGGPALDGDTVFDIGSITKLFTALVLSDMVVRGEMSFEDPVGRYLPAGVTIPAYDGKPIRAVDLANYAPGLPGWPANLKPLDPAQPFPDYTVADLYAALTASELQFAPGTRYVYSNFGFGLLGHVLALRAGMSFEDLVVSRICDPLGMNSTRIAVTSAMRARLATGHDTKLQPVASWDLPPAFAGAGAFRSTANDLFSFLEACTGRRETGLAPAFAKMLDVLRPADKPGLSAALGWLVSNEHNDELVWKDGATKGYSSFIGYSKRSGVGAILLANGQCGNVVTPLGKYLLNPAFEQP